VKAVIVGDIHLGITDKQTVQGVAADAAALNPDVIVFAGDNAESISGVRKFEQLLKIYRKIYNGPLAVVLGNHDLYVNPQFTKDKTSLDLWGHILKDKANKIGGVVWLEDDNFVFNEVALVGSYLHYDYSSKDTVGPNAGLSDDYYRINKNIADIKYHIGLPDDKEFARQIGVKFRERLTNAQNDDNVSKIIVVTHVPCMECLITRYPHDNEWSKSTAYFGNLSHEEYIKSCTKIVQIVSAHSHVQHFAEVFSFNRVIKCCTTASDYYNPINLVIEI